MKMRAVLMAVAAVVLAGPGAASAGAATLYGGGGVPATTTEPVPLVLLTVDHGRARMTGFSGGSCSNGRAGFGRFATHRFRLHRGGRFAAKGSFAFKVPGSVVTGSYRIKGRVRASTGLTTGRVSVRLRFPTSSGTPITCRGRKRPFRARNPGVASKRVRGPFYGVTAQGLPIVVRPAPDSSALAPVALLTTLNCGVLGPVQPLPRLRVPSTAPGVYASAGTVTGAFIPALGSAVSVPLGTYTFTRYNFQAQIASGRVTGTINLSTRVGNAKKVLIDTCTAPPIAFTAVS